MNRAVARIVCVAAAGIALSTSGLANTIGLDSVAAESAANAWAVGNTHPSRDVYKLVILHWNGTAWKRR